MIAGIAVDKFKLPVFQRRLTAAGYTFTEEPGITEDTLMLKVEYESIGHLWLVVQDAQEECKTL